MKLVEVHSKVALWVGWCTIRLFIARTNSC